MNRIDRRKKYYIILDTETSGEFYNPYVYDIGFMVVDKQGNIYEQYSYVIYETFNDKPSMEQAFYVRNVPYYYEELKNATAVYSSIHHVAEKLARVMADYDTNIICAYNASFDYRVLKQNLADFFNKNIDIWCIMKMAKDVICTQKSYAKFCEQNGFMTAHKTPRPRYSAEIVYRYITGLVDFEENHTGLEDCKIEAKIFAHCMRQHKRMRKSIL